MPEAPRSPDEALRLTILHQLNILDTPAESRFDEITEAARRLLDVPIVVINLIEEDRQWFKSCIGLSVSETPRAISFCAYTILQKEPLVIPDTTQDSRVSDNPLVLGEPGLRSYLGVPIEIRGQRVGTLCGLDLKARDFQSWQVDAMRILTRAVERELEFKERLQLVEELELSYQRTRVLFDDSPHMLVEVDSHGKTLAFNHAARAFWLAGWGSLPELIEQEDFRAWDIRQACQRADSSRLESLEPLRIRLKDGRDCYLRSDVHVLGGSLTSTRSYLVEIEDVTETALAADEQARLVREITTEREASLRRQLDFEHFAARLSHEMRNPLQGISGFLELFERDRGQVTDENLASLRSCVSVLTTLIDDTLDLERLQQGRVAIVKTAFDLESLLRETAMVCHKSFEKPTVDFRLELDLETRGVEGDPVRIRQVLMNLISNAFKYTSQGEVLLTARFQGGISEIEVRDTGRGIPQSLEPYIFEPYSQADSNAGDSKMGIGLGLAIAKHLVGLMNGSLDFESREGVGSSFRLTLPLTPAQVVDADGTTSPLVMVNLLLADDNPINRQILTAQATRLGCQVSAVENGREALELLRQRAHSIVLMDCQMPEMDGFEATSRIRAEAESFGHPVIIALTGSVDESTRRRCEESGMNDFLSKPVSFHQLSEKLAFWLASSSQPAEAR